MSKLLKIISVILFIYVSILNPIYIYWAKRMEDIWKIKFVFGKMGVGKSGLIAKWSSQDLLDPTYDRVYTSTGVAGTYKFNPEDLKEGFTFPPRSSVYIDEFGLIANSRDFKSFPKELRKWFKYARQSRIKLTIFSQAPDIDKSVRDLCHSYSLLRRIGPFVFEFDVTKNIDVGSDQDGNGQLVDAYSKIGLIGGLHIHYLPKYFGLWESYDPPKWDYVSSEYIEPTPALKRSQKWRRFYPYDLRLVYCSLLARISRLQRTIYNKFFYRSFFISKTRFNSLQTSLL